MNLIVTTRNRSFKVVTKWSENFYIELNAFATILIIKKKKKISAILYQIRNFKSCTKRHKGHKTCIKTGHKTSIYYA